MKNFIKISSLAICLMSSTNAEAQILGKLKDAANKIDQAAKNVKKSAKTVDNTAGTNISSKVPAGEKSYYSDNSITFSKSRNGSAEKNFSVNDNIYATVKLDKPLINQLKDEGVDSEPFYMMPVSLVYIINGAARGEHTSVKINKEDYGKTTLVLDILPAKGDAKSQYLTGGRYKAAIARPLSAFDEYEGTEAAYGTQKFDFTFGPNDEYHGAFNFTVKNKAEQKMMASRAVDGQNAMSEAIASETTLPEQFKSSGKFSDPALSLANIRKMIEYPGMTILKLVIDSSGGSDYHINKNALDVPTLKMTNKPVWLAYKEDGKCYFTKKYFTRDYEGGGKYGPLELAVSTANVTPIACENIK